MGGVGGVDADLVVEACVFGALAIAIFVLGLLLGRVKGTKQIVRWVFILLVFLSLAVVSASEALNQPEYHRTVDGRLVEWGRYAVQAVAYSLIAAVATLGIFARTRDILTYPIMMFFVYLFLLFGVLPDVKGTNMQHWIWMIFAGALWIAATLAFFWMDFGWGFDSKDEKERHVKIYTAHKGEGAAAGYRRGLVIAFKVIWTVVVAVQFLFFAFDPATGNVWSELASVITYTVLDFIAVGAGAFLLFWLLNPETNPALKSGGDGKLVEEEAAAEEPEAEAEAEQQQPASVQSSISGSSAPAATAIASAVYTSARPAGQQKAISVNLV